jgi:hypothetical protein
MHRTLILSAAGLGAAVLSAAVAATATAAAGSAPAATLPPRPVAAHAAPASEPMAVAPLAVAPGGSVTVKGAQCAIGTLVFIALGPADKPRELGTLSADSSGAFAGAVRIPAGTAAGPAILWAACKAPNPTGKLLHTATVKITG